MAGFAINLEYMARSPNATMPYKAGYEEDAFLKSLGLKMSEIEPKANNCSDVFVWHTQTKKEKPALIHMENTISQLDNTSLGPLLHKLDQLGISHVHSKNGK